MDKSKYVTGQVIVRNSGVKTPDGRELKMLVGILALPEELAEKLEGEHQYTVMGQLIDRPPVGEAARLDIYLGTGIDRTGVSLGSDLGHLVIEPIWRY